MVRNGHRSAVNLTVINMWILLHMGYLLFGAFSFSFFCPLQLTYGEPRLSHKKHSFLHKNHKAFALRVMASKYMFQKVVFLQKYQKQRWKYKLVCLVNFRCHLTVSFSAQSTGCTVPTSSQNPSLLRYSTVLYSLVINSVHSSPSFLQTAPRKSYLTCSNCEMEVFLVNTVHMVVYHYPTFLGLE